MAGYFSNHSQSRFLANSSNGAQNTSTTTMTATANSNSSAQRPRVPSSKHFSTSVSTSSSGDEKPTNRERQGPNAASNGSSAAIVHPLRNTWVFWFRQQRAPGNKVTTTNYEEGIKKISTFSSIESFWSLWTHLNPPSTLQPTTDYLLFHSGIRRPVWEDPVNLQGGKWIIRLKKGVADRLWEEIVMAVVGDQFDDCGPSATAPAAPGSGGTGAESGSWRSGNANGSEEASGNESEICGCTLSVRQSEDILSVWNRHGYDSKVNQKIKDTIRRVLDLPQSTVIEYKTNNDSMQDKSSFRTTHSDRTTLS